ncbi:MAG TPA: GNAT family N-acetyltransferase [Bryobacterales bacterium]|nr:GNAT family N-acetyltransferase [Bryobacterales bacterium]
MSRHRQAADEESFGNVIARAAKAELHDIQPLRALFLQENNFQIRYDACHERGWTDSYLLKIDEAEIGYGSIKGRERADRDTVFEFFVIHPFRKHSSVLFGELLSASGAKYIECQSNDMLLSSMLYEFSRDISANVVLFGDHAVTGHAIPGAVVRRRRDNDQVFEHRVEPVGDYVVALAGEVVATGGFMLHYNRPFADLYMEVRENCRGRGFGSFLLQELKKECYLAGRVPAARCEIRNTASRAALIKAGLRVCGFMLTGKIKPAG